jgi:predicted 3-demethylubiquinone-9 3-methyltransferase (glyoxalase superfamily)
MSTVTPFLAFDHQAEEAVTFYTSLVPDSRITGRMPGPGGTLMGLEFELGGRPYIAINGGPSFQFTQAFSLFVSVQTQTELDGLWDKLVAAGATPVRCGWITDRWGVSWQIIPSILGKLLGNADRAVAERSMQAMLKMEKLDIAELERAAAG